MDFDKMLEGRWYLKPIEQLSVDTIRLLSIDQIEKANSGHPGLPMGAAPMAYVLWAKVMQHNPKNPAWLNRDRFVLSAGHGSALLYSLLHVFGYGVSIDDLKQFRQWKSKTPGHPEVCHTPGVEATTGPLGQGLSNAVGMAMAEAHLAATYNREGFSIIDHYTYVLCSDGDLMEGVVSEACSLAGHLGLGKLIVLYDSNQISLDGNLDLSYSEDVKTRFEAYGWQYLLVEDGNDMDTIHRAIDTGQKENQRPTLIEVRTMIGYGSPSRAGTSEAHGKPLGQEEVIEVRKSYEWFVEEDFHVPSEVKQHVMEVQEAMQQVENKWRSVWVEYEKEYPSLAERLQRAISGELPEDWEESLPVFALEDKPMATRVASGLTLQALAKKVPSLLGGSADLSSSNNTLLKQEADFCADNYAGRNIWFGVREHGMGAILNGMALHRGVNVYGATFLVFSDYLRPAIRLAALSKLPVIYVFTHDSIAVGEDGPTHEPIEQIPSLRLIPGLRVIRSADANETVAAWRYALKQKENPVALILSRQNLPILQGTVGRGCELIERGGYVISEASGELHGIFIATGSEVSLAIQAQAKLARESIFVRVVSMPCRELFMMQPHNYQEAILPSNCTARVAVEAAHPMGWEKLVGDKGEIIGINHFGASAPGDVVMKELGFSVENVVGRMKRILEG